MNACDELSLQLVPLVFFMVATILMTTSFGIFFCFISFFMIFWGNKNLDFYVINQR